MQEWQGFASNTYKWLTKEEQWQHVGIKHRATVHVINESAKDLKKLFDESKKCSDEALVENFAKAAKEMQSVHDDYSQVWKGVNRSLQRGKDWIDFHLTVTRTARDGCANIVNTVADYVPAVKPIAAVMNGVLAAIDSKSKGESTLSSLTRGLIYGGMTMAKIPGGKRLESLAEKLGNLPGIKHLSEAARKKLLDGALQVLGKGVARGAADVLDKAQKGKLDKEEFLGQVMKHAGKEGLDELLKSLGISGEQATALGQTLEGSLRTIAATLYDQATAGQ